MTKLPALTRTALAVALAGSIGLAAIPSAFAQDTAPNRPAHAQAKQPGQDSQRPGEGRHHHFRQNPDRGNGHGLMDLLASPRGAEALDVAFLRLSYRVNLTDAQKPLFDDLKTTALSAQKSFADAAKAARDAAAPAGQRPDMMAMLKARLAIDTARLEAMNTVVPKLEAFMNSLDDTQKAALAPKRDHVGWQRPGHDGLGMGMKGHRNGGMPANPGTLAVPQGGDDAPAAKPTT